MNPSAVLRVTEKGAEEIARHTVGLGLRQRGIMLLLSKPRTLQDLLHKSVLPTEESYTILHELMRDGFITQDDGTAPAPSAAPPAAAPVHTGMAAHTANGVAPAMPAAGARTAHARDEWHIHDEAIISEARFLLVDFCMDCFGTQAQTLIDRFRSCKTQTELSAQTKDLATLISQRHPAKLAALRDIIRTINESA